MSKIQAALKKIQGGKSQPPESEDQQQIASITVQTPKYEDATGSEDGRILEIDRVLLREAGLLAPEHQERHVADQYRIIKRPILDLASGVAADKPEHANLVMVASALPGDGKTFNAINLALSIAVERDKSVLLVDADVAKPHISNLFGVAGEKGLIDLLLDEDPNVNGATIRTDVQGLSILPAGRQNEHATELLASRRMAALASALAGSVEDRIVVFDSPPLLVTSESRVLASRMGQIVLVVCAGRTPQQAVDSAIENLGEAKVVNLILNQAGTALGNYGGFAYGYGYGSNSSG